MPWVKLSDDWYDDPDLIEAGPVAMLLWPVLISWCARNLTDGVLPSSQVRRLVDWHALGIEPGQGIAPLIEKGRLQEIAGGYLIVNYLKFQPAREQVLADREKDRRRKAASRSGESAADPTSAALVQPDSTGIPVAPGPGPDPDASSSSSSTSDLSRLPSDLWTTMADKRTARAKIRSSAKGFRAKCIENDRKDGELIARAVQLVDMFEVNTSHLADCLIDGTSPSPAYRRKDPAA